MDKKRQNLIISLISIALLVLVGIQVVWVKQSMEKERKVFNKKTRNALDRAAIQHAKAENLKKYQLLWKGNFKGRYQDMLKEEFEDVMSVHEDISIRDTIIHEDGKNYNYLIITGKTVDSLTGLEVEHRVLAKNVSDFDELIDSQKRNLEAEDGNELVKWDAEETKKLFKRSRYINELMVQAFRDDLFLKANERMDLKLLDSIISNEFSKANLDTDYRFQVVDENNIIFKNELNTPHYYAKPMKSALQIQLFPGDLFNEPLMLKVDFPNINVFLWEGLWGVILIVALILFIMGATFLLMYRTLVSQRNLSEIKNNFISNMTHEFKTPISTIALACEALYDPDIGAITEKSAPFVSMIIEENKRLGSLSENILQSAVLEKGELRLNMEKVDFNQLTFSLLNRTRIKIESLEGKFTPKISTEECWVMADKTHLMNVINNLLDNAIKYSKEKPEIEISSKCVNDTVILKVTDHGIGMKKEHISRIFDNLYRIPTGNIHNVKGFGLGLSYVKSIVELHNGTISVESQLGIGSTFILTLKKCHE